MVNIVKVTYTINNNSMIVDVNIDMMRKICAEEIARNSTIIPYGKLAERLGMPPLTHHNELGVPLDEMNKLVVADDPDAPMLSAVVVHKSDRIFGGKKDSMPGDGFFILAKQWGRMKLNQDKTKFWREELKKVYEYWRSI